MTQKNESIHIIPNFDKKNKIQVPSGEVLSAPIQAGFTLEQVGIAPNSTICTQAGLLGGKVHGSLARAGKVKGQTPKVDAEEKKKAKTGRAKRRMQVSITALKIGYNDYFREFIFTNTFSTTDDSSTLFQHSARRRDQTLTHNYDLILC